MRINTFGLAPSSLAPVGQDFLVAGDAFQMPVTITIGAPGSPTPTFDGQSPVTLFRKGNVIINK